MKCHGLAEWETLREPEECECVTLLGQIISEIDTGSEKKKPQWGKREGKELCAQGLGFLIHAGTKRRAPPTAWLAGMPAMPRYRNRVHAGPGGSLQTQELGATHSRGAQLPTLSCEASVALRLSDLLKVRAKERCGGRSGASSLQCSSNHQPALSLQGHAE